MSGPAHRAVPGSQRLWGGARIVGVASHERYGFDAYAATLRDLPRLPRGENERLLTAYRRARTAKRREAIVGRLVEGNIRLVIMVALRLRGRGVPLVDRIQEGVFGLFRAIEKFDPGMKAKFSTYAPHWIAQFIGRLVGRHGGGRALALPDGIDQELRRLLRVEEELGRGGERPDSAALAAALGVTMKKLDTFRSLLSNAVPLETDEDDGAWRTPGAPAAAIAVEARAYDAALAAERAAALRTALAKLPPRDAEVLRMRFGMGCRELTLEQIGGVLGLTRERIRQLEARALKRLHALLAPHID